MGMTTSHCPALTDQTIVVEAYRLDGYDNMKMGAVRRSTPVVEAYRLDGYDNFYPPPQGSIYPL